MSEVVKLVANVQGEFDSYLHDHRFPPTSHVVIAFHPQFVRL